MIVTIAMRILFKIPNFIMVTLVTRGSALIHHDEAEKRIYWEPMWLFYGIEGGI